VIVVIVRVRHRREAY